MRTELSNFSRAVLDSLAAGFEFNAKVIMESLIRSAAWPRGLKRRSYGDRVIMIA